MSTDSLCHRVIPSDRSMEILEGEELKEEQLRIFCVFKRFTPQSGERHTRPRWQDEFNWRVPKGSVGTKGCIRTEGRTVPCIVTMCAILWTQATRSNSREA